MSYSPTIGRWLQPDSEEYIDGANRYQSEVSRPVSGIDPFGTDFILTEDKQLDVRGPMPGAGDDGDVRQEWTTKREINVVKLPVKQGQFCYKLELNMEFTIHLYVRQKKKLTRPFDEVLEHEYAHFNTWKAFWNQVTRLKWFNGKRYITRAKAEAARDKLLQHLNDFEALALAHSVGLDHPKVKSYGERPFKEKLETPDIPMDEK